MKSLFILSALGLMAAATDAPTAGGGGKSKVVTVKVIINSLGEGAEVYSKGQTFETTTDRAAALGDSVELVK